MFLLTFHNLANLSKPLHIMQCIIRGCELAMNKNDDHFLCLMRLQSLMRSLLFACPELSGKSAEQLCSKEIALFDLF